MKRFYEAVAVEADHDSYRVTLDGRAIRTQGGRPQVAPTPALAEALAREWRTQGDEIDSAAFKLRDMTDYAIDYVASDRAGVIGTLLGYAETDTLCYRADPDEPLYRRQREVWEPLLAAIEAREGVRFERVSGVIHRPQPPETLAKLRTRLDALDAFALAALQPLASLSASLGIALTALEPDADIDALWNAASLEELWQAELWGRDEAAEQRRERRGRDFAAAAVFARLARGG